MRRPRPLLLLTAFPALLVACGGGGGDDPGDGPDAAPIECTPQGDHKFVVDSLQIPTTAAQAVTLYGLDIDGKEGDTDQGIDNAVGRALAGLGEVDIDAPTAVAEAIDQGTIVLLANVRSEDLTNSSCAEIGVYLGDNDMITPAACTDINDPATCRQHLDGNGSFVVDANSPADAILPGRIIGGAFSMRAADAPGTIALEFPAIEGVPAINIDLVAARVAVDQISDTGLMTGVIGGAVRVADIENTLVPALQMFVSDLIQTECPTPTPGACCPADSDAALALTFLDADDNCAVTSEEIISNPTISVLLNADVDLFDANDNYAPNSDGENDSLSMGIGFTAVPASFDIP
ncbi:hypothetical protein [Haliangium sp.]|uniref:hypothetical protein n=1 Tax=Haliangium sp. TaxID=2663208 RepID=UPI003D12E914